MSVQICCEGPACNGGFSAQDRETAIMREVPGNTDALRDEAARYARHVVTRKLNVTPHTRSGSTYRGAVTFALFRCEACDHERVYGNSSHG